MFKFFIKFLFIAAAAYALIFAQEFLILWLPFPFNTILLMVIFPAGLQIYLTDKLSAWLFTLGVGIFAELLNSGLAGSILIALAGGYFLVNFLIGRVITDRSAPAVIFLVFIFVTVFYLVQTSYVAVASLLAFKIEWALASQGKFAFISALCTVAAAVIIQFMVAIFIKRVNPAYILDARR